MHRAVAFAAAAAASFIGTMLYMRHHPRVEHAAAPIRTHLAQVSVTPAAAGTSRAAPHVVPIHHVAEPATASVDDPDAEERRQLAQYIGGISNVAPVSAEQQQALLDARLRHKRTYEIAVRDAGLDRDALSDAEREHAHRLVARALQDYRDDFLLDAKTILADEQYELLVNYENTEFKRQLEILQIEINSK
jgi:hypothetical protein